MKAWFKTLIITAIVSAVSLGTPLTSSAQEKDKGKEKGGEKGKGDEKGKGEEKGKGGGFTSKYGLTRFIYCEHYDRIEDAIARERAVKKWRRAWKIELIEKMNPDWDDLYDVIHI
mgnify:CR=1 FL=1